MGLLRKKDLQQKTGIPKSTLTDWITEFSTYIPKVKEGKVTYFKEESIDILQFIKECREKNYDKSQIFQLLADKKIPINVEESIQSIKKIVEETPRDSLIAIMQTMGQAVVKIAEQQERIEVLEKQIKEMDKIKEELEKIQQEVAKEKQEKKGFFSRLFKK